MNAPSRLALGIIILLLTVYYTFVSLKLLLPTKKSKRIGVPIYFLGLALFFYSFSHMRYYDSTTQTIWNTLMVAYVLGFIALHLITVLFFLVDDIRRVFAFIFFKKKKVKEEDPSSLMAQNISRSKFLNRIGWLGGVTLFSTFFVGIKNKYNYQIKRIKLKADKSQAALKGLKIIHISDIHTGSFDDSDAVLRGIKMINEEEPDLILFTGDIVNHKTDEIVPFIPVLQQLKAKLGIYATLGNHDYGDYVTWDSEEEKAASLQELIRIQTEDLGWKVLMNEHVKIERNGSQLVVMGVENWGANLHFPRYGKLGEAYKGLENNAGYKILLSHDPSHWDNQIRPKFPQTDLTLSGHTHGMQFGIELSWFKWSPSQYVYPQWAGLYQEGQQQLYVNRGFGFLGYKGRVGILPEITVLEFDV